MSIRKIIVGCDGDERSRDALRLAALLAREAGAGLILANAHRHDRDAALRLLADAERTVPYGTRAEMRAIEAQSPAAALHALAAAESADLIVIGERRSTRGQNPFVTGARCPVAVAPHGFADDRDAALRVIGVAFDGSPESRDALTVAADLALASHSALKLIGVAERPPPPSAGIGTLYAPDSELDYRSALQGELEAAADELPLSLRTQVVLADGEAADVLIDHASSLSLLVMGSHCRGPFLRALLGSVSQPVLRAVPCPVLVVPHGTELQRAAA